MRLLVVTNDFPPKPGGIQQYLKGLVDAYPHPIRVLAAADKGAEPDARVVRHSKSFMWPTSSVRSWIEAEAKEFRADSILFGAPTPLPRLGKRLRSDLGIPFAVLSHGAEVTIPAAIPVLRRLVAGPLRAADTRLAVSQFTAEAVRRLSKLPVEVIGAGVDTDAFAPPDQPRRGATIGCVSRFVPRKGQTRLLKAVAELRKRGREVDVLLVGRGRLGQSLGKLSDRLKVPTRIEVGVPWELLGDLYEQMDIFCMPCRSRWFGLEAEGFGLVYLEAAATALPVLAGTSGGAPETVVPGETGFVVDTVDHIVEALEMLLDDRERAQSMGEKGRQRVLEEFTWPATIDRLLAALAPEPG